MYDQRHQKFCQECRGGNPVNATHCGWCGAPLMAPPMKRGNGWACVIPIAVILLALLVLTAVQYQITH